MVDEQSNGKQREQTEDEALVAFRELRARVGTGNGDRSSLSVPGSQGQKNGHELDLSPLLQRTYGTRWTVP
mgnify:CR=1 FL=1